MKGNLKSKLSLFLILIVFAASHAQGNSKFRVVLDAGHGGKDFGAIYHGFIEKHIALDVVLKVGKILEKQSDVQVIYTRKTDVFIELNDRPNIANKADANLFVSIHCNGETKKTAFGTETFVIGPTKNASQLEVAKKENDVIYLEENYKVKYEGYDPNKPESLIKMQLMQEELVSQSIGVARKVQNNFTDVLERKDRGVKQAPFLVLHKTAMPSILIELGFLSYKPEGEYLSSEKGKDDLAEAIAKAIIEYKKEVFVPGTIDYKEPVAEKEPVKPVVKDTKPAVKDTKPVETAAATKAKDDIVFKVQIAAGSKDMETTPSNFKGLSDISKIKEASTMKYFYGNTSDYNKAKSLLQEAKAKGFTGAFVVAFEGGKKITVQEALKKQ